MHYIQNAEGRDLMEKYIDDDKIHQGHRSRMREKLSQHGQFIFDTYELLEMLLYQTILYRDTNPIAKNLLYAFGGLDGVFNAPMDRLTQVVGVGERTAEFINKVGRLSDIIGAELIDEGGVNFADYESVGRYITSYFSGVTDKQVVALYLDSSMRLISMKKMYDLEYESGGVKPKPFIDEALTSHAAVVITAHNHPYGPFYPTQGDRATNVAITDALNLAGIVHAEHYIISGEYFAGLGSLKSFNVKLAQMPAVSEFIDTRTKYEGRLHKAVLDSKDTTGTDIGGYNRLDLDYFASLISYSGESDPVSVAYTLIRKYGTIENSITASVRELSTLVSEGTAIYLKLLAYVTSRRKTDLFTFGKKHTTTEIAEYLKALFLGESVEKTYIINFDRSDRIIGCQLLGEGTVNASEVMPRKAVEAAVRVSARAVAIAHNHPFGTPTPSTDDVNITQSFRALFDSCEIELKEHFVVAGQLCDTIIS